MIAIFYFVEIYQYAVLDGEQLLFSFLRQSPIFSFFIWLVIFMGNRRAENQKLEEAYKHKEAMAKSYTGYKNSIEELGDDDNELLKQHMKNLLDAIKEDPSKFLSSKGESHPAMDLAKQSKSKHPD